MMRHMPCRMQAGPHCVWQIPCRIERVTLDIGYCILPWCSKGLHPCFLAHPTSNMAQQSGGKDTNQINQNLWDIFLSWWLCKECNCRRPTTLSDYWIPLAPIMQNIYSIRCTGTVIGCTGNLDDPRRFAEVNQSEWQRVDNNTSLYMLPSPSCCCRFQDVTL
jgi:hypothetical protein